MASPVTLNTTGPVVRAHAKLRYSTVTPMKARRVIDLVRGLPADEALSVLKFTPQSAAEPVYKVLESAVANARYAAGLRNERVEVEDLVVSAAYVDEGPTQKRFRPRAQGRAYRIRKRTSHITIEVETWSAEIETMATKRSVPKRVKAVVAAPTPRPTRELASVSAAPAAKKAAKAAKSTTETADLADVEAPAKKAPAKAAKVAKATEAAPAAKKAMSTPSSAALSTAHTLNASAPKRTDAPALRSLASARSSATGKRRSWSTRSTVLPAAPVAPTIATTGAESILFIRKG